MSQHSPRTWLVSACLFGQACRYDGRTANERARSVLPKVLEHDVIVPLCPEVLGGLSTPRPPARLCGGDGAAVLDRTATVRTKDEDDVTEAFLRGAKAAEAIARAMGATHACLKARSPSCGAGEVHLVTVDGRETLAKGDGVTAALLKRAGLKVFTDEELQSDANHLRPR